MNFGRRRRRRRGSGLSPNVLVILVVLAGFALLLAQNPEVGLAVIAGLAALPAAWFAFRVWRRRRARERWFAHLRTVRDLQALSPSGFENAVSELLRRQGFRDVELVGGTGDIGADIRAKDPKGRPVIVQCKRYADQVQVDSPAMQRFLGSLTHYQALRGIFVTTSTFTLPARKLAATHGIELWDAVHLTGQMAHSSAFVTSSKPLIQP
jgi:restriction system protein